MLLQGSIEQQNFAHGEYHGTSAASNEQQSSRTQDQQQQDTNDISALSNICKFRALSFEQASLDPQTQIKAEHKEGDCQTPPGHPNSQPSFKEETDVELGNEDESHRSI